MRAPLIIIVILTGIVFGGLVLRRDVSTTNSASSRITTGNVTSGNTPSGNPEQIQTISGRYTDFSESAFDLEKDKKRVYFFHAAWCPTCRQAHMEFDENEAMIPEDVILYKTDYDTQGDLKKRYTVTYQHTFVAVDAGGREVTKWNGGGIRELQENTDY